MVYVYFLTSRQNTPPAKILSKMEDSFTHQQMQDFKWLWDMKWNVGRNKCGDLMGFVTFVRLLATGIPWLDIQEQTIAAALSLGVAFQLTHTWQRISWERGRYCGIKVGSPVTPVVWKMMTGRNVLLFCWFFCLWNNTPGDLQSTNVRTLFYVDLISCQEHPAWHWRGWLEIHGVICAWKFNDWP